MYDKVVFYFFPPLKCRDFVWVILSVYVWMFRTVRDYLYNLDHIPSPSHSLFSLSLYFILIFLKWSLLFHSEHLFARHSQSNEREDLFADANKERGEKWYSGSRRSWISLVAMSSAVTHIFFPSFHSNFYVLLIFHDFSSLPHQLFLGLSSASAFNTKLLPFVSVAIDIRASCHFFPLSSYFFKKTVCLPAHRENPLDLHVLLMFVALGMA